MIVAPIVTTARPRTTPSGDQAPPSGEFRGLTGLRIVAALWVVLFHFHFTALPGVADVVRVLGPLITAGDLGVDLFFVLSGFVIAHTYLDKLGPALRVRSTARFVWARACRMWPVYALVFNLFGIWLVARMVFGSDGDIAFQAVQPVVSVGEWLQQIFMVQMWNNEFLDGASWVGPTWSLSAEWLAYLLFPVAALGFFRMRKLPIPVLALSALVLMMPLVWAYVSTGSPYYPWSWMVRILCGFGAGVLAQLVVRRLRPTERVRRVASSLAAGLPVVVAVGLLLGEAVAPGRGGAVIVVFPLLVASLALADRGPAMVLSTRWAVRGGRISFCLYLVHIPLFEVYWLALRRFKALGPETMLAHLVGVLVILAAVAVAAVAYHLVEEPSRKRLRRMHLPAMRRRTTRRPAAVAVSDDRSDRATELVHAFRAALAPDPVAAAPVGAVAPEPRHAASPFRQPTLASVLVNAQRRPPMHRAELAAAYERAEYVRTGYMHAGN